MAIFTPRLERWETSSSAPSSAIKTQETQRRPEKTSGEDRSTANQVYIQFDRETKQNGASKLSCSLRGFLSFENWLLIAIDQQDFCYPFGRAS
mmetsp:Transcript_30065/g.115397  ORF Transcript_30065/g.115397 Transcript_30065/m.115397 type:complete len:93 (-) Transcript_30065:396-674(-)